MPSRPMTDVVVLLPGITGSVLQKDGKDVWAASPGAAFRALVSFGRSITELELHDDSNLDDGVTAPRVMPDVHLVPGLWKIDGYGKVARYIRDTLAVRPGRNFFEFPYDWRRDNRVAARQLKEKSDGWLFQWRKEYPEAKLILVGHSMGGLVSRYFLESLEGWRDTRSLVTFGTPFRGSLNALAFIVHGMRKGLGPITLLDLSKLLRSFTSVYQLLPIYPCYQAEDGKDLVRLSEATEVPFLDPDRAKAADGFHREIEQAVEKHLDDDEYMRARYAIHPIIGTFQPTSQSARQAGDTVDILREYRGEDRDGDGTVPRDSATPIELKREEGAMYASERHASLQNLDAVLVQLAGVVTGRDTGAFRDLPKSGLGLDLEDAYATDEPIAVRVRSEDLSAELVAVAVEAETGREVERATLPPGIDEWREVEIPPVPAGTYRLTVSGGQMVQPVTDVFVVYDGNAESPEG
jgi:pimeloyl-ACP methyl ester carboxylesterase